jgi:hypothetical protein
MNMGIIWKVFIGVTNKVMQKLVLSQKTKSLQKLACTVIKLSDAIP